MRQDTCTLSTIFVHALLSVAFSVKPPVELLNFNWFIWGIRAVVLNAQHFGEPCVVMTDGSLMEIVLLRQYWNGLHVGWSVV